MTGGRRLRSALVAGLVLAPLGCHDAITEIGSAPDQTLDRPDAFEPLVNGMGRALSHALNLVSFTGAAIAREATASGSQSVFGVTLLQREGVLDPAETDEHWQAAQQARWVAEDGVRRMREVLDDEFDTSPHALQALVHVGFANRLLGQNMCQGVIDGGPPLPRTAHLERAEAAFDEALAIATRVGSARHAHTARAGRASVRVGLGDWAGAREDAETVPLDFRYDALYSAFELEQYNRIYWGTANQPYRSLSVWDTYYEDYYLDTGDPRVAWTIDPEHPEGDAGVPWYIQLKYRSRDAPIALVTGREMRLIIAEADLRAGDVARALTAINALRAEAGVGPWEAASLEAAWTALKRERGIELWLEGRRLGDLHRWTEEDAPGTGEDMTGRSVCFPIGQSERVTNPNVP
jgi:hypothetical protein